MNGQINELKGECNMAKVVLDDACDACWKKDKTARASVMELTLKGKTWFLCGEHEDRLSVHLTETLGEPETEESE